MCGIVGIASLRWPVSTSELIAMRDTMAHRGPDDAGVWPLDGGPIMLGHRRLAVIDLTPLGHQPMTDAAGELVLVFNGEIYNFQALRSELIALGHAFRSGSDTEVIIEAYRAWGPSCLERLEGMFAFCLYDRPRQRLLLARDRAGEKPLFYRHADGVLWFASELKALMAHPAFPRRLNIDALNHYLAYGHIPGSRCVLEGVNKLPAGCAMTYDLREDRMEVWPYWQLPAGPAPAAADPEALVEELHELLRRSVRSRLVADVPVGVLLSGGIDSSLVTAAAAEVTGPGLRTFTVTFPGHGAHDEGPYARQVAEHFGTRHTELAAAEASVDLLERMAEQFDEPMGDASMIPTYLVSCEIRRHATVALGGDGGDELFGGYQAHRATLRLERLRAILPGPVRRALGAMAVRCIPAGRLRRNGLLALAAEADEGMAQLPVYWDVHYRRRLLGGAAGQIADWGAPEICRAALGERFATPLQKVTAGDFLSYLPDDILVKIDRASMLTSLEVRCPLLSRELIEFAFTRVPDRLRATTAAGKILPRLLARRLLPRGLDLDRKQGFTPPVAQWFAGAWRQAMEEPLRQAEPSLFDRAFIAKMIDQQHRGYDHTWRLFALTMFELWRRRWNVAVPAAEAGR
ncbi:MAG: asparagine synthase (glutamine-hydrolyzing) [Planctomycetaceae bacterium]|nr:asparagine synthase (glutamine-hydrolyzing) [Planctomycetaceae bacterium]